MSSHYDRLSDPLGSKPAELGVVTDLRLTSWSTGLEV
jgi:hypothetical protein